MLLFGEHSCPGCGIPDQPLPRCAACGARAVVAVACEGWRSLNVLEQPATHSVSWCQTCWRDLQEVRPRHAPALQRRRSIGLGSGCSKRCQRRPLSRCRCGAGSICRAREEVPCEPTSATRAGAGHRRA
jgi:hypothetical protein